MSFQIDRTLGLAALATGVALLCAPVAFADHHEKISERQKEVQAEKAKKYRPTGELRVEATSVQIGLGFQWGRGTLSFQGKEYAFSLKGLELVGVGVTRIEATGQVFNLDRIEDFAGTYGAVTAGGALGTESAGGITMRSGDVYITLKAAQTGAQLSFGGGSVTIKLEDAPATDAKESGDAPAAESFE